MAGADPAGCSAAIFLARKGLDVSVVDKAEFPRDRICGDGISISSFGALKRIGIFNDLQR